MAINRFSTPVQSEYISQYVPIPFEQLYAIGKEYNDRLDKAYEQIGAHIQKYKDFQSPSAVDTARWNEIMQTNVIDPVNQLMANPDALKTQAGKAQVQKIINSMPYGEMSELMQSRDSMLQRQKLEQQLSLAGKYNPLWHGMDYTNYSTANAGIFNDLNLLPYTSEIDLVKPYVDNLKSSYIGTKGLYDINGVSEQRTIDQVDKNMSAIMSSPYSQKHIESLQKRGMTREQAEKTFIDSIYTAAKEFSYQNLSVNPLALLREKQRLENKGKEQSSLNVATPRQQLSMNILQSSESNMLNQLSKIEGGQGMKDVIGYRQGQQQLINEINKFSNIENPTELEQQTLAGLLSSFNELKQNELKTIQNLIRKDFNNKYGETIDFTNYDSSLIDSRNFGEASREMINSYSAKIPTSQVNRLLEIQLGSPVEVTTKTGKEKGFVIDSNSTLLPQQLALGMLGVENPLSSSPTMSNKRSLLQSAAVGAMTGFGTGAFVGGATTLGIGAIPGGIGGAVIGAGTAILSNIFSEGGDDDIAKMWSDSRGFGDITVIPSQDAITVNTVNGDMEYVKAKAIIPKQSLSDRDIDKSVFNSRDNRMKNTLNATSNDENDTYEFDVYIPLSQSQASAKEYDRESSNLWYGATTSDSDRYYEDMIEYSRLGQN